MLGIRDITSRKRIKDGATYDNFEDLVYLIVPIGRFRIDDPLDLFYPLSLLLTARHGGKVELESRRRWRRTKALLS